MFFDDLHFQKHIGTLLDTWAALRSDDCRVHFARRMRNAAADYDACVRSADLLVALEAADRLMGLTARKLHSGLVMSRVRISAFGCRG